MSKGNIGFCSYKIEWYWFYTTDLISYKKARKYYYMHYETESGRCSYKYPIADFEKMYRFVNTPSEYENYCIETMGLGLKLKSRFTR